VAEWGAIILAAGRSKRMKTSVPKVLHTLCGQALIDYVLEAVLKAGVSEPNICVVVGYGADQVKAYLSSRAELRYAVQHEQLGTGHAVACAAEFLGSLSAPVFVLAGDMPLITAESLIRLREAFAQSEAACAIGTAVVEDPSGLGRVVRTSDGQFHSIVEEADATEQQKALREINTSIYVFQPRPLLEALEALRPDNQQGELYLTDCPAIMKARGETVVAVAAFAAEEALGVNSRRELARAHEIMQRRIHARWMDRGVTILDPRTVYIDARARIGPDTTIHPFSYIDGPCLIGQRCSVGPFAYLGPGTRLEDGACCAGNLGPDSKTSQPPHP